MNYAARFFWGGVNAYTSDSINELQFPTKICVMDELAKRDAVKEGLPESDIVVTRQPYFDGVLNSYNMASREKKSPRKVITFVSEPLSTDYKNIYSIGYNEHTILRAFLEEFCKLCNYDDYDVVIKLHPREDVNTFEVLLKDFMQLKVTIEQDMTPQEVLVNSDFIVGMSSMLLIEAATLQKPVLSIQIGLSIQNPFVLDRLGVIKSIVDRSILFEKIEAFLKCSDSMAYDFKVKQNATDNVVKVIREILWEISDTRWRKGA